MSKSRSIGFRLAQGLLIAIFVLALSCVITGAVLHVPELFDSGDYALATERRSFGRITLGDYQLEVTAQKDGTHASARPLGWGSDGLPHTRAAVAGVISARRAGQEAHVYGYTLGGSTGWTWDRDTNTHDADREASAIIAATTFESCFDASHERIAFRFHSTPQTETGWDLLAAFPETLVYDYIPNTERCEDAVATRTGTDWIARGLAEGNSAAIELAGTISLVMPELLDRTIAHRVVWQGPYNQDPAWHDRLRDGIANGSADLTQHLFDDIEPHADRAEPEPGPRGNGRLDEWVGELVAAVPDVEAKHAFVRRMQASCDVSFGPCAAPFRLRATARAALGDTALCDTVLGFLPRVLASGRDDVETGAVALMTDLRECASQPARERAALAVLSLPQPYREEPITPGLAHMVDFDACVGQLANPPVNLRYCSSLAVLASWQLTPPCDSELVALARRLEARPERPWVYATLNLLEHCGESAELTRYATQLRATGAWTTDPLIERISPASR